MKLSKPELYIKLLLDDLVKDVMNATSNYTSNKFMGSHPSQYREPWNKALERWDKVKQEIIDIVEDK